MSNFSAHHEFMPSNAPGDEHACATCGAPASGDEHVIPIEMDASDEPSWLRDIREQIAAAPSHAALNTMITGLMRWPEERKVQIRPLIAARRAQLDVPTVAVVPPSMPAFNRMVQTSAPVRGTEDTAAHVVAAARISDVPVETVVTGTPPHAVQAQTGRPMLASWRRIDIAGPYSGQWGAAVEHTQHGLAIEPPVVGSVVLVARARGERVQPKRIAAVLRQIDGTRGYSLCAVADPIPGARATLTRPRAAASLVAAAPAAAAPVSTPSAGLVSLATIDADLADRLGAAASEGAANASVVDLGAQNATGASSTAARRLGVGFSTVEQYIEALRRGGLQPHTRAEYIATVIRMGGTLDPSALPPANAAFVEPTTPDAVTVHDHRVNGQSIFNRPRSERGIKLSKAASEVKTGAALLRSSDLIGWLGGGEAGGDFSWAGQGEVKRAELLAVLTAIGREGVAPGAKNARAQAGRAVGKLGNQGYDVHAVQGDERRQLPPTVAHRWIVGRVNATGTTTPGASTEYGQRVLVVDLHRDDTLHFDSESTLATEVKTDYEQRCAADTYISADLTAWLQRTLRDAHGATRFGVGWYVPAGQRRAAEALTRAVATVWGASWRHGMPVVACSHLFEGIIEGLADEATKIEEAWAGAQEEARAANRIQVTTTKAAGLLRQVFEASERVRGYAVLLTGDGADAATVAAVETLKARLATLDGAIRPLTDDTSARASMLEFS